MYRSEEYIEAERGRKEERPAGAEAELLIVTVQPM